MGTGKETGKGGAGQGRSKNSKPIPTPPHGVRPKSCPIPAPPSLQGGGKPAWGEAGAV